MNLIYLLLFGCNTSGNELSNSSIDFSTENLNVVKVLKYGYEDNYVIYYKKDNQYISKRIILSNRCKCAAESNYFCDLKNESFDQNFIWYTDLSQNESSYATVTRCNVNGIISYQRIELHTPNDPSMLEGKSLMLPKNSIFTNDIFSEEK